VASAPARKKCRKIFGSLIFSSHTWRSESKSAAARGRAAHRWAGPPAAIIVRREDVVARVFMASVVSKLLVAIVKLAALKARFGRWQ
jgi:hypothetical protein